MPRKRKDRRIRRPGFCVFPGYRYCGPGCSGPGEPINAVDAACRAHDECYRIKKDYCACDRAFLKRLKKLQTPETQEGRHAHTLYQYMKVQKTFTCF
ncbi:phospholipase [Halobacillus sp. ACCC02827]|nr:MULTISPECIES: phospholipase A2 family enzyme [Bacillaceae]QHT45220.1 phospholipase [Bacillus sp. SB49]WJE16001.1 phospholipase [Halobacillus sp. ACCC02827]